MLLLQTLQRVVPSPTHAPSLWTGAFFETHLSYFFSTPSVPHPAALSHSASAAATDVAAASAAVATTCTAGGACAPA